MALLRMSRTELFSRLQLIRILEPLAGEALHKREELAYSKKIDEDSPHGRPWHTSFHASSFPGDRKLACPRKALYTLMDFPKNEPFSPKSRLMMEMGKTVEQFYVEGFHYLGILLSAAPWEPVQTGFVEDEVWLTGNSDAIICPPKLGRPHVWECKMKYQWDLEQMLVGLKGPEDDHVAQAKTYVAGMRPLSLKLWPDLPQLRDGTLFYAARDNPRVTAEFFIDYDPAFYEQGMERLKQWKEWFCDGILPSQAGGQVPLDVNAKGKEVVSKRHPLGSDWRWTYQPCQWCDFSNICKADHKDGVTELKKSNGVDDAMALRPGIYQPEKFRQAVFDAWEEQNG